VPVRNWPFSPNAWLHVKFYPRNSIYMFAVKLLLHLDLEEKISFMNGH